MSNPFVEEREVPFGNVNDTEKLYHMFEERLFPMYPFFAKDMTKASMFEWQRCLEKYTYDDVDAAITKWLRSKEGAKKSPMPGDLIALIPNTPKMIDPNCIGNGLGWNFWGLYTQKPVIDPDTEKPALNPETGETVMRTCEASTVLMESTKSVDDVSKYFLRLIRGYGIADSLSGYTVKLICPGEELFKKEEK